MDGEGSHLWTPWRMAYVQSGTPEAGCIFCNRLVGQDDVTSLIVHRDERFFVIMNLFPYNTGHVMLVPNDHVASPESCDPAVLADIAAATPGLLRALRRALGCDGFNLGTNVGVIAGAGVANHLHQHVVPRWMADANFMPILAGTKVLPELLPATYAKIRAELVTANAAPMCAVAVDPERDLILTDPAGRLPRIEALTGVASWRTASEWLSDVTASPWQLVGWVGDDQAGAGEAALAFIPAIAGSPMVHDAAVGSGAWRPVDELTETDRPIARRALACSGRIPG